LQLAGVTAISARSSLDDETLARLRDLAQENFIESSQAAASWLEGTR
jgi:hypothetical protein